MGQDVVWTFALQIGVMVCAFVITKLLASRLSIDDFGQYNVIKRSVQVLSFVMLAGVGIALPRYIPLYRNSTPPRRIVPLLVASLVYILGVSLVVLVVCLLFSTQMQDIVIGQTGNGCLLLIALGYAFTLAMAQFVFAYYRGTGNFKWYNGTQLAVQLAIVVPLVLLPVLTVKTVFVSWLVITALLVALCLVKEGRGRWGEVSDGTPHFTRQSSLYDSLKTIVRYSSGRLVADFFLFSLSAFPLIYISQAMGLQATAYYAVGITFVTMVTPVFSFIGIILLPYVSACIAKGEMQRADKVITRLLLLYLGAALLITVVLYIFTDFMTALRIMILAILPQALYLLYRNPIDAVAVVPYNTVILGICLTAMVVSFVWASTLTQYAWAYLTVSILQGLLSWLTWQIIQKRSIPRCP